VEDIAPVALTLEQAQTVALGPFNPFIITPEWLDRTSILSTGEAEIRFKVIGEGAAFEFSDVSWEVNLGRLVVSSRKEDCGEIVAKVLEQLHHTPVHAIGNNFHFTSSTEEWGNSPLPTLGQKSRSDLVQIASFEQARWVGIFHRDGVRVEITLISGDDILAALINHHRETDPREYQKATAAARQFTHDREISEQILGLLLSQEVKK
jgi:hypothetical protein